VWAAVEAPALVVATVLLGPSLADGQVTWGQRLALQVGLAGPWRVRVWDSYFASLFPTRKPEDLEAYRRTLRANLAEAGRFEAARAMLSASKAACSERMASLRAPALLIMGDRDPDYADAPAIAETWGDELHAQVALVPGAGHYPHVDSPDAAAGLIMEWMQRTQFAHS